MKICKYCGYKTDNGLKLGGHVTSCKLNPNYENRCKNLSNLGKNRVLSIETRKKISEGRIKYLKENPDGVSDNCIRKWVKYYKIN